MPITFSKWLVIAAATALAGCTGLPIRTADGEHPVIQGPATRANHTVFEPAFACLGHALGGAEPLGIAVGDIKDYTGRYSQNEGNTITQGGALMVYSALGKLGDAVRVHERFDTRIAELELAYTERRQLGDGASHQLEPGKTVPWVPYYGGSILRSQYYIIGGITELNYNIASGGAEVEVNGVGVHNRVFAMNVGVDLRIVDTRTLVVRKALSLQKQIVGDEVGVGVFRFFGKQLVDINIGQKSQEPLQLGVRTTLEHGVLELIAAVGGVDVQPCLQGLPGQPKAAAAPAAPVGAGAAAEGRPLNAKNKDKGKDKAKAEAAPAAEPAATRAPLQNGAAAAASGDVVLPFEPGSTVLPPAALTQLDNLVRVTASGSAATVQVVARDNEPGQPQQRRELAEQRARAVQQALEARGVAAARIAVSWLPDPTEGAVRRHGPGLQLVATLKVSP